MLHCYNYEVLNTFYDCREYLIMAVYYLSALTRGWLTRFMFIC